MDKKFESYVDSNEGQSLETKINRLESLIQEKIKSWEVWGETWKKLLELLKFKLWKLSKNTSNETCVSLEDLKASISMSDIETEYVNNIYKEIEHISQLSRKQIENLKSSLLQDLLPEKICREDLITWKYFSNETIDRCNNPKCLKDHILWIEVWLAETLTITWKFLLDTVKWIWDIIIHPVKSYRELKDDIKKIV